MLNWFLPGHPRMLADMVHEFACHDLKTAFRFVSESSRIPRDKLRAGYSVIAKARETK